MVWLYDRRDRLAALAERCRRLDHDLYRMRCDVPRDDAEGRARLDARRAVLDARRGRLQAAYRAAGRLALT